MIDQQKLQESTPHPQAGSTPPREPRGPRTFSEMPKAEILAHIDQLGQAAQEQESQEQRAKRLADYAAGDWIDPQTVAIFELLRTGDLRWGVDDVDGGAVLTDASGQIILKAPGFCGLRLGGGRPW